MQAVLYARFSPRPAAALARCESIEEQQAAMSAWCVACGHTVIASHVDRAVSGKSSDRPGLAAALADVIAARGLFVVAKLDRLARNTVEAIQIAERLQVAGAELAMLDLRIDTSTPLGRCFFTIVAAFADLERAQIARRTSDAMRHRQAAGRRVSDRLPFGWRADPDSELNSAGRPVGIMPCPVEQEIIALIVDMHGRGWKFRRIGRELARRQITCRGGRWHHATLSRIIRRAQSYQVADQGFAGSCGRRDTPSRAGTETRSKLIEAVSFPTL